MFLIDLDDTLLNTQAFKEARVEALRNLGVSEKIYKTSYQEAYQNQLGVNVYNNVSHAQVLEKYGFSKQVVLGVLHQVEKEIKTYLFPDAIDLLGFLKKTGQKLILLSLGEESFQKIKIRETGLAKFFDLVYTVNDGKDHIIEKILKEFPEEKEFWFINDKIEETKKLIDLFPQLKPILKMSPVFSEAEYKSSGIPYFSNLNKIKQYVEQQIK